MVLNKRAEVVRVYLPPDANCLLSVGDHCLRSRNYVNVIVAGKQPQPDWLPMDDAIIHCTRGAGIWEWASSDSPGKPDVVLACCGDIPTLETLAAVDLLRQYLPELKVRVVNVVDLMRLLPETEHPHGMSDAEYDSLFTVSRPVIFAFHGYPWLIHRLAYRRHGHNNLHVRGYKERGTTTTPFDMVRLNDLDRFHLVIDVIDRVPQLAAQACHVRQLMTDCRLQCRCLHPRARRGRAGDPRLGLAVLMRVLVVNAGRTCQRAERGTAAAAGSHIDLRDAHRGGSRGHECGVRRPRDQHVRIYRGTGRPQSTRRRGLYLRQRPLASPSASTTPAALSPTARRPRVSWSPACTTSPGR